MNRNKAPSIAASSMRRIGRAVIKPFRRPAKTTTTPTFTPKDEPGGRVDARPDDVRATVNAAEQQAQQQTSNEDAQGLQSATAAEKTVTNTSPVQQPDSSHKPAQLVEEVEEGMATEMTIRGSYAIIYNHESADRFRLTEYLVRSGYTPNAVSMFQSLEASYQVLYDNEHLRWKYKNFLFMPVTLYFGVVYWIRLLHVREMAGVNTTTQSRFYRRFEKKFPLSSLPIPGFLEPIFATIALYKPKDQRIKGIHYPEMSNLFRNDHPAGNANGDFRLEATAQLTQPDIPLLYDWFKTYTDLPNGDVYHNNSQFVHDSTFVPNNNIVTGQNYFMLGYHEITKDFTTPTPPTHASVMALGSLGVSNHHVDSADRMNENLAFWRQTNIHYNGPSTSAQNPGSAHMYRLEDFMRMPDQNWEWFTECIAEATTFCKFFHGATNLKSLDVWGSKEQGIVTEVTINSATNPATTVCDGSFIPWFPRPIRRAQADLRWFEPQVKDHHRWLARHATTNSAMTMHWIYNDGTQNVFTSHRFAYSATTGTIDAPGQTVTDPAPRHGPFYSRGPRGTVTDYIHRILGLHGQSAAPIDVYSGRREMILNHFYNELGQGNPNF